MHLAPELPVPPQKMSADLAEPAQIQPRVRTPEELMKPGRLGVLQTSRLSATNLLMSKAIREKWSIEKVRWDLDDRAQGTALYRIQTGGIPLDFVVNSFEPKKEGRIGRIIARTWDMMGALIEGPVSDQDIDISGEEIKKLYSGRATPGTLVWARSNRSGRAFDHTVDRLAEGRQPDVAVIAEVCYLMRNTGLDGNGTFGTRSFRSLGSRHPVGRPLEAQMLCAYMMRVFSIDLVEHLARCRNPNAARLDPKIQRFLGVGNGSALGLVLFINNHPKLVHNFLAAREQAILGAKTLSLAVGDPRLERLLVMVRKAIIFRDEDRMEYDRFADSKQIAADLRQIERLLVELKEKGTVEGRVHSLPLSAISDAAESRLHPEAHETYLGLITHLVPDLCDELAESLPADEEYDTEPEMSIAHLRDLIRAEYRWALEMDMSGKGAQRYIWYKSVTAEEPRRGPREELGDVHNLGLDLPGLVAELDVKLSRLSSSASVGEFLATAPEYRFIVARIQTLSGYAYHSPHMNMMGEELVPSELTRFVNICIHGIDKTRDYLNRNLRGVIYQGAPTVDDIRNGADENWMLPSEPRL